MLVSKVTLDTLDTIYLSPSLYELCIQVLKQTEYIIYINYDEDSDLGTCMITGDKWCKVFTGLYGLFLDSMDSKIIMTKLDTVQYCEVHDKFDYVEAQIEFVYQK